MARFAAIYLALLLATLSRIAAAMPRGMLDLASPSINDLTA